VCLVRDLKHWMRAVPAASVASVARMLLERLVFVGAAPHSPLSTLQVLHREVASPCFPSESMIDN
jgi:hypothetical protein